MNFKEKLVFQEKRVKKKNKNNNLNYQILLNWRYVIVKELLNLNSE